MTTAERLHLRPYAPADRDACLAILAGNVPRFFKENEQPEFVDFLDRLPCPFFVVEEDPDGVIGCGGYAPERGRLCWGMVAGTRHRQGVGRFLLRARLVHWYQTYGPAVVTLSTSQYSCGFFAREGFLTTRVTEDGFAPGLHRHDMELRLDEERYQALADQPAR